MEEQGIYFAYLRKSREDREAGGAAETLSRHRRQLKELAVCLGIRIDRWFEEVASGETVAARPQMMALLEAIEELRPAGVLVVELERLARGNTRDQGLILETFQYAGTKIITPLRTYDPWDEWDQEYAEFGLFMSRREYKAINRRLQRGRYASFKEGKWTGNRAPFGYERIKLPGEKGYTLRTVPGEAEAVKAIFRLYAEGLEGRKLGPSAICRMLEDQKVPGPSGGGWQPGAVRRILDNPVYAGMIRRCARGQVKVMYRGEIRITRPVNPHPEIGRGLHPAIVAPELFERAKKRRMAEGVKSPCREPKTVKNPLAGVLFCARCGRPMYRRPSGRRCPGDMIYCPAPGCNHASYLELAEAALVEAMERYLEGRVITPPPDLEAGTGKRAFFQGAKARLARAQAQLERAMELVEQGIYTAELFEKRRRVLEESMERARQELEKAAGEEGLGGAQGLSCFSGPMPVLAFYWSLSPGGRNAVLKSLLARAEYEKEARGNRAFGGMGRFCLTLYPRI